MGAGTMKAAITRSAGGPVEVDVVPDPVPGPGEVLIRVRASSINRLDRMVHDGIAMGGIARFPLVQGIDASGIVEVGGGTLPAGTRVAVKPTIPCGRCRWCMRRREADCADPSTFGIHRQGGWAEYVSVPSTNLAVLPDETSFAEGAAAAHSHAVVLRMIRASGIDPEGATVLVTGGSGALGTAAIQLTGALGATVLASTTSEAKRTALEGFGADHAFLTDASLAGDLREATDGIGVDLVLETTGHPDVVASAAAALARGGRMVIVGATPGARLDLDLQALYRNRHAFVGSASSDLVDFADAYRLIGAHGIHPVIADALPLERVDMALDRLWDRNRVGKIVIEIGGEE